MAPGLNRNIYNDVKRNLLQGQRLKPSSSTDFNGLLSGSPAQGEQDSDVADASEMEWAGDSDTEPSHKTGPNNRPGAPPTINLIQ